MDGPSAILDGMSDPRDHYHHGNLREALVDAAQCLISEVGVANLSLRQVAKHAGVSQAAPYHHFPNKDALLAEVAFRGFTELTAGMRQAFEQNDDPRERILAIGRVYVAFGLANPAIYRLMFGAEHCPGEDFPMLQETASETFGVLLLTIAAGQERGVFGGDEPLSVGLATWSAVHGLVSLLHSKFQGARRMGPKSFDGQAFDITPELFTESTLRFVANGLSVGASKP